MMAVNDELIHFVRDALARGASRPQVEAALRQAGCAMFEGESRDSDRGFDAGFWSHRAGRQCFQRAAECVR